MDMELEQKQEELINHFVQQASSLSGPDLAFLIVEATSHPSLFAFSKILSVPSILQLEGTEDSVYLDVLRLFADGTLSDYKRNAGRLPQLVHDQELKLKQLTVLTLAETNKELPYDQLMQQLEVANVPELEEFLIHKCMHVGIVRGEVDTLRNRFEVQFAAVRNPRSLKDRAYWDHAQHRPWLISSLEVDGKEAEEPKEKKKKKKRKNKMKAKQKNSSHDDLEAKYGLDEEEGLMSGEEEGLKSEEAERLRSEEEEKKKGIIEDSGKTKTRTTEMNRQQRKRKKDRKARKRAAMVGENTSVKKKNKDKKGQKKEPVSTVPLDTSSSSGESESAQDEVSTVLSTPSKHQTGEAAEAAAIMHDVLANEDRIADERTAKASELKQRMALLEVECADLNHELQDMQKANMDAVMRNRELTVTRMMQAVRDAESRAEEECTAHNATNAAWEREVELEHRALEASKALAGTQRIADERTAKASELEQRMALLEVECANLNHELQDMQKRIADERTAKASELEQRMALLEVECANYQVECANLNQELQDMQKLNSDAHAFKQFEDSFNAKLEAQFQTLDQKFEKSFNSKLEAHYQTLGQQDVQLINMQRKLENQMTKIEKAVEQKLNSNADAFNQFEKLFNSKPEAQFQTLAQQAVQVVPPRNSVYSLVYQDMYADAFAVALAHGDVHLVAWICRTINLGRILPKFPFLLSQDQLIALFKLLASDVNNDRLHKIVWMMTVADCIILADPHSGECARSVLSLVNQSLFNILDTSLTSLTLNETEVRGIIQLTDIITRKLKSE